ncbi:BLUF domain-containing protein [Salinarimonas rosea]|uniref:BLUF domain-containing protein n=1 Tax=Salinarimonas rosea TaxID=552063 RepID=UPI0004152045|nr:BLUF domain-containing protein [Salinarimonas rosea]
MTTLARLVYVSRPRMAGRRGGFLAMCDEILVEARRSNADAAITGVLVAGPGLFAQVLEGGRAAVSETFARICRDPRHEAIEILEMRAVDERRFAKWSMAFSDIDGAPAALVARFRQGRDLDVRAMTPTAVLAFMEAAAQAQAQDNALLGAPRPSAGYVDDIVFVRAAE